MSDRAPTTAPAEGTERSPLAPGEDGLAALTRRRFLAESAATGVLTLAGCRSPVTSLSTPSPARTTPASMPAPAVPKAFGVNLFGGFEPNATAATLAEWSTGDWWWRPSADAKRHQYFASRGLTLMRYQGPRWEFVQPAPLGPLSTSVVRATKSVLDTAQAAGTRVILALNVSTRRQAVRTADGPGRDWRGSSPAILVSMATSS